MKGAVRAAFRCLAAPVTEMEALERTSLDRESLAYAYAVTGRLEAILGEGLVGVYLHGSAVLGDFSRSRSDVDLVAVLDGTTSTVERENISRQLASSELPCPAVGLEFHLIRLAELDGLVSHMREAGLPVELQVEGEPTAVPQGVAVSAYRIVQEALTNVLKHAGPARARVVVRYASRELELEIADDGQGARDAGEAGHGLVGMRERVALYGGDFDAGARNGGGFVVRARLPLGPTRT